MGDSDNESSDNEEGSDWEEVPENEYHEMMARIQNPDGTPKELHNQRPAETEEELQKKHLHLIPENGLQIIVPHAMGTGRRGDRKSII